MDYFQRQHEVQMPSNARIAMALEYNGSAYHGWQTQTRPPVPTVQDVLQKALSIIAAAPVTVFCAGRTDSGVHACHQLVHFETPVSRSLKAWVTGVNAKLPADISVKWVQQVPDSFHARFVATSRRYRYIILNQRQRSAQFVGTATHVNEPLDAEKMHHAAQALVGEHDFSSFRASSCQSPTAVRNIHFINVSRHGRFIMLDIEGNAFLHHMVRNIVGVLLKVGQGDRPESWVSEVLEHRDRRQAGVTAKPHGLYLVDVSYPAEYGLPRVELGPDILLN